MTKSVLPFVLAPLDGPAALDLEHVDSAGAKRAARFWIGKEAPSRKAECLEHVTRAWRDASRVARVVAALRPEERTVLAVVRRFGGSISGALLRRELLARGVVEEPKREDRYRRPDSDPVHGLCGRLVLVGHYGYYSSFNSYSSYGLERDYPSVSLPRPVAARIEPAASLEWKASARVESAPRSTHLRAPTQMVIDLEQTARALEAQGAWKVNQGEALPAAGRARLGKLLPAQAGDPLQPPDRVALHYSLLCALGLVELDEGQAWIEDERVGRLFHRPLDAQASDWIRAWLTLRLWQDGVGAVPDRDGREESTRIDPSSLRKARELLVWALTRVAHTRSDWLDLETFLLDLYTAAGERGLSLYWSRYVWQPRFASAAVKDKLPAGPERSRAFWMDDEAVWAANALLSTFVHLGVVERGLRREGRSERWAFRLTETGRAVFGAPEVRLQRTADRGRCLTIQPSHEILLYLDGADGAAVTTLGRIASRESTAGMVQSFKLTRASVYGALEAGMTGAAIESFLTSRSRNELPANVSHSLAEWSRKREALVVRRGVTLGAGLPDGQDVVRGRAVSARFVVGSARATRAKARERGVATESESAIRHWTIDEQGLVSWDEPLSLVASARLRRFAGVSRGRGRITSESVRAARDLGIPADQVLSWLGAHARQEVPPVLASAIRNWAGARGKLFLGDVVLIQVGDPKAFDALRRSGRLQPLLEGTLAPGCLVVAAEKRAEAARLLAELGFSLDGPCTLESAGAAEHTRKT